jgi:DNA primase small subunit
MTGAMDIDAAAADKRHASTPANEPAAKRNKTGISAAKDGIIAVDTFNPALLRQYYSRLFPYERMFQWLSYGHDPDKQNVPGNDPGFFQRREISFTLAGDVYIRYLCFRDCAEFKKEVQAKQPHKMDLGAIYNAAPKGKSSLKGTSFEPVARELVFDIDLTDYDDVRTSAQGAAISERCWKLMSAAIKVIDGALRADFGFEAILWVYSGRRGIHCWVCDPRARNMTDQERSAVAKYLSLVEGNDKMAIGTRCPITSPMHPALERAYEDVLLPLFLDDIIQEEGQALLSNPDHWHIILDMLPDVTGLRQKVKDEWGRIFSGDAATDRWNKLTKMLTSLQRRKDLPQSLRRELLLCPQQIVLTCTYPRLDVNVSTHRNHLLKSPFVAHPKTGRVCVPIDATNPDGFSPFDVPTLGQLVQEIDAFDAANPDEKQSTADIDKTSLAQYMTAFDENFIEPLYRFVRRDFREAAEKAAAETGDW